MDTKKKLKIPEQFQESAQYNIDNKFWSVFISGLPYTTSKSELEEIFVKCGQIEDLFFPLFQDSGRSRGFAHIKFDKKKGFIKALKKNGMTLGDRYLSISPSKGKVEEIKNEGQPPKSCRSIFVRNLPYDTTEDAFGDFLEKKCGKILNIRFIYHSKLQHFKGFCYVDFTEASSVEKAIELTGSDYNGRKMRIDWETGKPRTGFKHKFDQQGNEKYRAEQHKLQIKRETKQKEKERAIKRIKIVKGLI